VARDRSRWNTSRWPVARPVITIADCCKTNGSPKQQVTAAKSQSLTAPAWTPLAWALPALFVDAIASAAPAPVPVDTSPPLNFDRPAYIRFSVLLI
jgi:hypothetical protein